MKTINNNAVQSALATKDESNNQFATLSKGMKLSDVQNLDLSYSSWLISSTGSGKSYFVANCVEGKRIIAVPTTGLADEFESKYGASKYYEGNKEITNYEFIVVTYDSIKSLVSKIDISQYKLFVDECHNFVSSSSKGFRWNAMTYLRDIVKYAKTFHLMTATYLYVQDPMFNIPVIHISSESSIVKHATIAYYEDINATVKAIVDENYNAGNLCAILLNDTNKDGALGRMIAAIGTGVVSINSKTKNSDDYKNIVVDGVVDDNTRALITTTILKEGNSITAHKKNVTVMICGVFHPIEIEQYCARFRNAESVTVVLMRRNDDFTTVCSEDSLYNITQSVVNDDLDEYSAYLEGQEYERLNTISEESVPVFDIKSVYNRRFNTATLNMNDFISNYSIAEYPSYVKTNERHFRITESGFQIDHLLIANEVFEHEKSYAYKNNEYFCNMLSVYGWITLPNYILTNELDEVQKQEIKEAITEYSEAIKLEREQLYSEIEKSSVEDNIEAVKVLSKIKTKDISLEKTIREKVLYINHFTKSCEQSISILREIGHSKRNWTNFVRHASMMKSLATAPSDNLARVLYKIKSSFEPNLAYTPKEISETINKIRQEVYIVRDNLSETKCTQILNLVYNTSRSSSIVDGLKVPTTKIQSEVYYMNASMYDTRNDLDKILDLITSFSMDITFE